MYCSKCGKEIHDEAVVCPHCGCLINGHKIIGDEEGKSWVVCLLLWFFLGGLGVHRFYTGHVTIGIIQLLTLCGCGIWWVIDGVLILCGKYRNVDGSKLQK